MPPARVLRIPAPMNVTLLPREAPILMSVRLALLAAIVAGSFLPSVASAQDPKFEKFEGGVTQGLPAPGTTPAPPPPKPVTPPPPPKVWTVQLKAGLLATTGN